MHLAGVPLEQIQVLYGHDLVAATEIYAKRRMEISAQLNHTEQRLA